MDKHTKALELDKILEMVAAEASSEDGAQLARELSPVHTAAEAKWLLEETDAAFVAMAKFGAPSFYNIGHLDSASGARRQALLKAKPLAGKTTVSIPPNEIPRFRKIQNGIIVRLKR